MRNSLSAIPLVIGIYMVATVVHMEGTQFWLALGAGVALGIYLLIKESNG